MNVSTRILYLHVDVLYNITFVVLYLVSKEVSSKGLRRKVSVRERRKTYISQTMKITISDGTVRNIHT